MTDKITLYHGTSKGTFEHLVSTNQDLYGCIFPHAQGISGNLTLSPQVARIFSFWHPEADASVVMRFQIPKELVTSHGNLYDFGDVKGFSTALRVHAPEVPKDFLEKLHSTRLIAEYEESHGCIQFFRVPMKHFDGLEA